MIYFNKFRKTQLNIDALDKDIVSLKLFYDVKY